MFTGIIEEVGEVKRISRRNNITLLEIKAARVLEDVKIGDSIAVNGVCLTLTGRCLDSLSFDVMPETLKVTMLSSLKLKDKVNLERALKVGDRVSGHFINGHIDCTAVIRKKNLINNNLSFEIVVPGEFMGYLLPKGSIAVDGISLTIFKKISNTFTVHIIPHTLKNTTLGFKRVSDKVNIEFDKFASLCYPKTMKNMILFFLAFFFVLSMRSASAYWIWTPKTGKWINPKTVVRSTPKEQFDFAKSLYDTKSYAEAKREFQRLIKSYPKSVEAAESQYYLGCLDEAQGNLYEAFLAYQKVVDKYPFSERIQEIIEREYKIGETFMSGEKRRAFGMTLPVENPSIEIFNKVIENSNFGPLAAKAQYKLGLVLKGLLRYYEAEDAFNKVISSYPDSEWAEASKYQIAACRQAVSRGSDYDQGASAEAKEKFEEFVSEHPDAVLSKEAEKNIEGLKSKEAESNYNIAYFYEKQRKYEAARIYYNDVINNCSNTLWAAKALERLQILEKKE
ncbi:MAG: riboflavin synthase [Candidatus Omnitrophota bacterium]